MHLGNRHNFQHNHEQLSFAQYKLKDQSFLETYLSRYRKNFQLPYNKIMLESRLNSTPSKYNGTPLERPPLTVVLNERRSLAKEILRANRGKFHVFGENLLGGISKMHMRNFQDCIKTYLSMHGQDILSRISKWYPSKFHTKYLAQILKGV